jgi:hypothetical protein
MLLYQNAAPHSELEDGLGSILGNLNEMKLEGAAGN